MKDLYFFLSSYPFTFLKHRNDAITWWAQEQGSNTNKDCWAEYEDSLGNLWVVKIFAALDLSSLIIPKEKNKMEVGLWGPE